MPAASARILTCCADGALPSLSGRKSLISWLGGILPRRGRPCAHCILEMSGSWYDRPGPARRYALAAPAPKYYMARRVKADMARQSMAEAERRHNVKAAPPYLQPLGGLDQCARAIEDMLGGDPCTQVSMLLLVSAGDIIEAIRGAAPKVEIVERGGTAANAAVLLSVKGAPRAKPGRILVASTGVPHVYLAITHEGPAFVRALPSVLEDMYPHAFVPRLTSGEMRSVLGMLESETGLALMTMRIVSHTRNDRKVTYRRSEKKARLSAGRGGSEVIHIGVPYEDSIESSIENDQWIGEAQFILLDGNDVRLEGRISRDGLFRFRHSFLLFKQRVLPHILGLAGKRLELYSSRLGRDNGGGGASPLVIGLEAGALNDSEQRRRFIRAVQGMRHSSGSVYRARPYLSMSVVDLLDGSSFRIWIMTPDEITIVPQARATQASLSRLIDHIFERFQEGDVREYG